MVLNVSPYDVIAEPKLTAQNEHLLYTLLAKPPMKTVFLLCWLCRYRHAS